MIPPQHVGVPLGAFMRMRLWEARIVIGLGCASEWVAIAKSTPPAVHVLSFGEYRTAADFKLPPYPLAVDYEFHMLRDTALPVPTAGWAHIERRREGLCAVIDWNHGVGWADGLEIAPAFTCNGNDEVDRVVALTITAFPWRRHERC